MPAHGFRMEALGPPFCTSLEALPLQRSVKAKGLMAEEEEKPVARASWDKSEHQPTRREAQQLAAG